MKRQYTFSILGRDLQVVSDNAPEHMRAVEALLTERAQAIAEQGVSLHNALMLLALNLADELVTEQERRAELREKIRSKSALLLERLQGKLAA